MTSKSIFEACHDVAFKTEAPTLIRLHLAAVKLRFQRLLSRHEEGKHQLHAIIQTLDNAVWKSTGSLETWSHQVFFLVAQLEKASLEELHHLCTSESERVTSLIAKARGNEDTIQDYYPQIDEFPDRRTPHVYIDELKAIANFANQIIDRRYLNAT